MTVPVTGSAETLAFDLITRDRGATQGMRGFGDEVAKTGRKMDGTAAKAAGLSAEIENTTLRVEELREELAKTGDRAVLRDLQREQRTLATLQKARRELGGLVDDAQDATKKGLTGIGGLLGAGFSALPPQAQAAVAAGIVAAVAAASPLIGAALGAALLTGVGGGVLAAGIASAVQDHRVAEAFKPLAADAVAVFESAGEFFKRPLVAAVVPLRAAIADIRADMILAALAVSRLVEPLANGVRGFAAAAFGGGGFLRAVRAAGPVLTELAEQMPRLGEAVDTMFRSFASAGPGAVEGMRLLATTVSSLIILTGEFVEHLSKAFDWLTDIGAAAPAALGPIALLLGTLNTGAEDARKSSDTLFQRIELGAGTAADEVARLNTAYNKLFEQQMSVDEATNAFRQGMFDLKETLKDNGKTLDVNTEKGLANERAVLRQIQLAQNVRQAEIDRAGGTEEATKRANDAYLKQLEMIRTLALTMGLPVKQLDEIINAYKTLASSPPITKVVVFKAVFDSSGRIPTPGLGQYGAFRAGGVHYAQTGLLNLTGQARTFSAGSPLFGFAEPGTGGEAFIARNAPRGRSLAIGAEAMAWHGAAVVPRESMGSKAAALVLRSDGGAYADFLLRELRRLVQSEGGGDVQLAFGT